MGQMEVLSLSLPLSLLSDWGQAKVGHVTWLWVTRSHQTARTVVDFNDRSRSPAFVSGPKVKGHTLLALSRAWSPPLISPAFCRTCSTGHHHETRWGAVSPPSAPRYHPISWVCFPSSTPPSSLNIPS